MLRKGHILPPPFLPSFMASTRGGASSRSFENGQSGSTRMGIKKDNLVRIFNVDDQRPELPWKKNDPIKHIESPFPPYKVHKTPFLKPEVITTRNGSEKAWPKRILDPGSDVIVQWNRIFLFSCIVALFVDPLFFYLPIVRNSASSFCLATDSNLEITLTFFRTVGDVFSLLNIVLKFRTAYVSPSSRVFGRGELVMDPKKIAGRYLRSDFFIDLIATLPLPQIVIWFVMRPADHTDNTLVVIVLLQYVPKLYLIFPLSAQIIKATGVVTKNAWAGAAYNLLLYMLASHVLGAAWYLLSLERLASCWKSVCRKEMDSNSLCSLDYLLCSSLYVESGTGWEANTTVFSYCNPAETPSFNFGIFAGTITNNALSTSFLEKYFYCFWWGLQNLSSYGQNLTTSSFVGETVFASFLAIVGLVLFAHLIGNMQNFLQSMTIRLEEWRLKRRDTEEWMNHRQLPRDLQERVRRFVLCKWVATRGVDEESILRALPTDLRRDIQRHLSLDLVRRVPFFAQMDDQLLDAICERLVSSLSTQGTDIVREGDPVTEMLFVIRGCLESSTTNGGRSGFFNSITLRPGDFCGEELLSWALLPTSSASLPLSTRTVKTLVEVEAFALCAEDLKFVANQFRRLHSKKLQHTFRYYSHQWRTWASCYIQSAWRQHKKRKLSKTLSAKELFYFPLKKPSGEGTEQEEDATYYMHLNNLKVKQNLGVTILASMFAANTRRGVQKVRDGELNTLQKPDEPDFAAAPDD